MYRYIVQRRRKVLEVGGGGGTNDGACIARGVCGRATPKIYKTRCSELEIASEAIFVLKSGQFLSCASL